MGLIATAMACLSAIGCPGPPAEPLPPPKPFAIHYERSGGLKPMAQELTIRPGRQAVASSAGTRAGERTVRFRVSRKQVASLKADLRQTRFSQLQESVPSNCADCFIYSIEHGGHEVTRDQTTMPKKLAALVTEIESLIYAHTIPPNA
jgi:hypothetical protein